jgi:hypothetical protein
LPGVVKSGENRVSCERTRVTADSGLEEGAMRETRREFLAAAAPLSLGVMVTGLLGIQERPRSPMPDPPRAAGPSETTQAPPSTIIDKRRMLEERAKEFRERVQQLYDAVGELKQEVEATQTADIFSVGIYRETEKIEKLAKQLKSKAKE